MTKSSNEILDDWNIIEPPKLWTSISDNDNGYNL